MRIALALTLILANSALAQETFQNWPSDIAPTKTSLAILGSPKEVKETIKEDGKVRKTNTYIFYKNGLIKKSLPNTGGSTILIVAKNNEIKKIIHASHEIGNSENGETFRPKTYDSLGRVTLITSESIESNVASFNLSGSSAIFISYKDNIMTEDRYYKSNDVIGPLNRIRTMFTPDGFVLATCFGGEAGEPCSSDKPIVEYGPHGITRSLTGGVETIYNYENGLLISEVRSEHVPSKSKTQIKYSSYALDECKNWISRDVSPSNGATFSEHREISYYIKCSE